MFLDLIAISPALFALLFSTYSGWEVTAREDRFDIVAPYSAKLPPLRPSDALLSMSKACPVGLIVDRHDNGLTTACPDGVHTEWVWGSEALVIHGKTVSPSGEGDK